MRLKWSKRSNYNKEGQNKSNKKKWERDGKERKSSRIKWRKKSVRNNKLINSISNKSNKFKKSCKIWLKAKEDNCNKEIIKRRKLFKICWQLCNSKKRRESNKKREWEEKKKSTWFTWKSWILEKRLWRLQSNKNNKLRIKYFKSWDRKRKKEEGKLRNFRI